MRLLLDTHVLLHALAEPERLTRKRSELITDDPKLADYDCRILR